jgi:hypothetical protein
MTDEGIALEYETDLASDGKQLNTCSNELTAADGTITVCGWKTHRGHCPVCTSKNGEPLSLSGDTLMDEIMAKTEDGEEFDLEHALRYGMFVPVTIDEVKGQANG